MSRPLTLGKMTFPVNLVQGPLAGVSCAPFRKLAWRYGQLAFTYTEMISAQTFLTKNIPARYTTIDPQEGPVCFQLAANDPIKLSEAVKRVTDLGASLIDLNCGCPVKKIRSKGMGSALLSEAAKLYQLIMAMKNSTHLPVSIKIRVQDNFEIIKILNDAQPDFVTVHGRQWTEDYSVTCRYDGIKKIVNELTIPVIGNGDTQDKITLNQMTATGCAGVMISRATVGQPWLFASLVSNFPQPSMEERKALLLEHARELITLLTNEKQAIWQMRKLAKYYARDFANRLEFCADVNRVETFADLEKICHRYFS